MKITRSAPQKITQRLLILIFIIGFVYISGKLSVHTVKAQKIIEKNLATAPTEQSGSNLDGDDADIIITEALSQISQYSDLLNPEYKTYEIGDLHISENWAFFNLVSYPKFSPNDEDNFRAPDVVLGLAYKDIDNNWKVHLELSGEFFLLLAEAPDSLIDSESKNLLVTSFQNGINANATYKITGLPWAINKSWRYNQGPHGGTQDALDFGVPTPGVSDWVKAADSGTVIYKYQTCIGIKRSDNLRLWYQHIRPSDISKFSIGNSVTLGQNIGMTTVESGCGGYSTGHHVHFYWDLSSTQPIIAEGSSMNGWVVAGNQLKKNGAVINPTGSWILYSNNPPAPNNLAASDGTYSNAINISWSAVTGATSYQVWRNTSNSSSSSTMLATITSTIYSDTNTTPLIPYYYWVKACNNNGCSGFSAHDAGYRGQEGTIIISRPSLNPQYEGDMCVSGWHQITGFAGEKAFLTLNTNIPSSNNFSGTWQPNLPVTGQYKVEVFIPAHESINWQCPSKVITSDTIDARYDIYHASGKTTVTKNQASASNTWINLGTYTFNAGTNGKVQLTDLNNEASLTRTISFSAIKFTYEPQTENVQIQSIASYDGWIRESSEFSDKGGTMNNTASTILVGDDSKDRQYRAILSFDTSDIPINAKIIKVTLKIKSAGVVGTNPFNTHGKLLMDVYKGAFSNNNALQFGDWQATASKSNIGNIPKTSSNNWHTKIWTSGIFNYVNKGGITQFRLRFATQDNDDLSSDYLKIYSGNAGSANAPQLIIEYYVP